MTAPRFSSTVPKWRGDLASGATAATAATNPPQRAELAGIRCASRLLEPTGNVLAVSCIRRRRCPPMLERCSTRPGAYWRLDAIQVPGAVSDLAHLPIRPSKASKRHHAKCCRANLATPGRDPPTRWVGSHCLVRVDHSAPAFQGNNDGGNEWFLSRARSVNFA